MNLFTIDTLVENYLYGVRTPELVSFFSFVSNFGSVYIVAAVALAMALYLWLRHERAQAYAFVITLVGAVGSEYVLKLLVERARPDIALRAVTETSSSFPSGHATIAVALYGFIGLYFWRKAHTPLQKAAIVSTAALIILLIGFSRLYLGVHYPTDVLGGYLLGALWLTFANNIFIRRSTALENTAP